MVFKCCVPNCRGNYDNGPRVSVFSFPKDDGLRQKWIAAIRRSNFEIRKSSKVCQRHFTERDIRRYTMCYDAKRNVWLTARLQKIRLRADAIPSVFADSHSVENRKYSARETEHNYTRSLPDQNYCLPGSHKSKKNCEDTIDKLRCSPKKCKLSSWHPGKLQFADKGPKKDVPQCGSSAVQEVLQENSAACASPSRRPLSQCSAVHTVYGQPLCAVLRCLSNTRRTTDVCYHYFPKDEHLRLEWVARCGRAVSGRKARVCSLHFQPEDYIRDLRNELLGLPLRKKLQPTAVPSLNLPSAHEREIAQCEDRSRKKRVRKRKKTLQCGNDEDGNMIAVAHEILMNSRDEVVGEEMDVTESTPADGAVDADRQPNSHCLSIKEEIVVKQEVESDHDGAVDAGRPQELEHILVEEEPVEPKFPATEELSGKMVLDPEMPLVIIKEEIDCDDYDGTFGIPKEAEWY